MKPTILIAVIITLGLLTLSIILIVDLHRASDNEVINRFHDHQSMIVRHLTREIERYLRDRSRGAQVLSTFASLQHRDMKKMAADLQEYFEYMKKEYVKAISVYDEKGTIIYSTTQEAIGRNYANCDFFQWATRKENKGKQFVSSLIRATTNQIEQPTYFRFVIAAPVYQEARGTQYPKPTHKFVGVLTYTIDLEEVIGAFLPLMSTNVTKEQVWIMDTSGAVLFQSEHPEMILKSIRRRDETCMRCHVSLDYVEKVLAERQGTIEYALREQPKKLAAFAPFRFENAAWIIVVNASLNEASGFLQRQLERTFLLIGVIAVALVGASAFIYRGNRLKIQAQEEARQWREKRELEDRIRISEERYRTMVETAHDIVWTLDTQGNFTFINRRGEELTGHKISDLIGKSFIRLIVSEDLPKVQEVFLQTLQGTPQSYEVLVYDSRGKIMTLSVNTVPLYEGENVVGTVSFGRDITERKRAEETLKESEQRFRSLTEFAITGVYLIQESLFRYVNPVLASIFGYGVDEIVNKLGPLNLTAPEDRDVVIENIRKRVEGEEDRIRYSFKGLRKDGQRIDIEVHGVRIDYNGKPAILGTLLDITERKRAESLRSRLSQVLESIAGDQALPQVLEGLVRAIEEYVPDIKGSVLLLDATGKRLRHGAAPSLPDDYNAAIDGIQIGPCVGSCGTAAYEKRLVIVEDIQTDPLWADFCDLAGKHGLRACWSQPIIDHEGAVLGTFALYYQQPRRPTEAELELINTAAHIARIAIRRKLAEEALYVSEERWKYALEGATDGVWDWNAVTNHVFYSQRWKKMLGFEEHEIGNTLHEWDKRVHPDDRAYVYAEINKHFEGKTALYVSEHRVQCKDGSYKWILDQGKVVSWTDDGKPLRVIGTHKDITERKRAQEDLLRSLSLLTATLESTADGILVVDTGGKIVSFNQKFVDMWRIPASIIASRDDNQALAFVLDQLKDPEGFLKKVRELYAQPEAEGNDILEFMDGRVFERYSHPQRLAGTTVGRVWSFRDITEQRNLEEQFRQAQKMESLGTLAGGIAHDFNNILGIMLGHASLLGELPADPATIKKNTEAIIKAGKRGAALVKQLLTFARKADVVFESVLLNDIVNELSKLLAETFPKTITISLDLEANLPSITADATQLHQVLLNLCVNARDAMPNGGTLTITTRRQSGEITRNRFPKAAMREYIALTVADTGTGMDEATRSRIFEPFFTTKERGKGTGLGLSLVFGIVESHNGFVAVESVPGKGTVFHLCFPVLQQTMELEQGRRKPLERISGGNETILIVEDEEMLTELMKIILEEKGYTVLTASDGDEAVALYTRHQGEIRLVLSDMGLPRMNGSEVYRKLKNLNPGIRMILTSGFLEPEMKSQILREGARYFIQKPYTPDTILRTIRRVLDVA